MLLHGLLGSRDNWHGFAAKHSTAFRFIVPDLVNHGDSPHVDVFDYSTMTSDVALLLESLRIDRACFVGHSMGGKVAMEIALEIPKLVKSLVVEDMVPSATSPRYSRYIQALLRIDVSKIRSRREAEDLLASDFADRRLVLFLLKNLTRSPAGFYWRANLNAIADRYDAIWAGLRAGRSYSGPALFVRGGRSNVVTDARKPEILAFFPQTRIATIENADHWVHASNPDEFDRYVIPFLDES